MKRRDRPRLFAEILRAIVEESRQYGEAKVTRVQTKVYVPFDRFKEYVAEMRRAGLIEESSLKPTDEGLKYLRGYVTVLEFLRKFGFE